MNKGLKDVSEGKFAFAWRLEAAKPGNSWNPAFG
jgi:hypothetical protein